MNFWAIFQNECAQDKKITWDNYLDHLTLDGLVGAQLLPNPSVLNQKIHWVCCFCQINDYTFHCRPNSFRMACACSHQSVKAWLLLLSVIIKSNMNGEFVSDSKFQDWKKSKWNVCECKNLMKLSLSQIEVTFLVVHSDTNLHSFPQCLLTMWSHDTSPTTVQH